MAAMRVLLGAPAGDVCVKQSQPRLCAYLPPMVQAFDGRAQLSQSSSPLVGYEPKPTSGVVLTNRLPECDGMAAS